MRSVCRFLIASCLTQIFISSCLASDREEAKKSDVEDLCSSFATADDLNNGIGTMEDLSCLTATGYDQVGCFGHICRFCKITESDQSHFYPKCTWLKKHNVNAKSPNTGKFESTTYQCTSGVADGDVQVGISAFYDATCLKNEGIGCIGNSGCRFCKARETMQSRSFIPCPTDSSLPPPPTTSNLDTCSSSVSSGDKGVGISAYNDASCLTIGGLGCFGSSGCRYCRTRITPQSSGFLDCVNNNQPSQNQPSGISPVQPRSPATEPNNCEKDLSIGDKQVGISAFYDTRCANGGVGCFGSSFCRFCKTRDTDQSSQFGTCPSISPLSGKNLSSTTPPTTSYPPSSIGVPIDQNANNPRCSDVVPVGDQNVGISAFYDTLCLPTNIGGVGCIGTSGCRFCKFKATMQSGSFVNCPSVNPTSPAPQPATCDDLVSASGMKHISHVKDAHCEQDNPQLVGCVARSKCRLCRSQKTEENQYLVSCNVIAPSSSSEPLTLAATSLAFISTNAKQSNVKANIEEHDLGRTDDAGIGIWVAVGCIICMVVVLLIGMWNSKLYKSGNIYDSSVLCHRSVVGPGEIARL